MNDQPGINMLQKERGIDSTEMAARKAFLEFIEADARAGGNHQATRYLFRPGSGGSVFAGVP